MAFLETLQPASKAGSPRARESMRGTADDLAEDSSASAKHVRADRSPRDRAWWPLSKQWALPAAQRDLLRVLDDQVVDPDSLQSSGWPGYRHKVGDLGLGQLIVPS